MFKVYRRRWTRARNTMISSFSMQTHQQNFLSRSFWVIFFFSPKDLCLNSTAAKKKHKKQWDNQRQCLHLNEQDCRQTRTSWRVNKMSQTAWPHCLATWKAQGRSCVLARDLKVVCWRCSPLLYFTTQPGCSCAWSGLCATVTSGSTRSHGRKPQWTERLIQN